MTDRPVPTSSSWRSAPLAIFGIAVLILLAGIGVVAQSNAVFHRSQVQQAQSLADVLAASTSAAVDFEDAAAAQQSVEAFRVNRQIASIGIYDRSGALVASYERNGAPTPRSVRTLLPTVDKLRVSSRISSSGQQIGTVYIDMDTELPYRAFARYALVFGMFLLAALVVASLGLAQTQLRRANRELARRAEALGQANVLLEEQVEERAKAEDQLRQSQKMQALGQLTGGIAHDFNNQLTVIQGSADMLTRPVLTEDKRIRFAKAIVQAATNAASLTSQLLAFARRQPLKPEHLDMNELVSGMLDMLERTMGERIRIITKLHDLPCSVEVDRAQLQSAILNIASNARDAMPSGGTLTIRTRDPGPVAGTPGVALELEDSGEGMPPDVIERVFEPFYTTKGMGKGTGLGLSQVYGFASQSGGDVQIRSEPGKGTAVTLLLPCVDWSPSAGQAPAEAAGSGLPPSSILVVEDNEDVGAFAETLLTELGHRVTRTASGEEALRLAREATYDLVLSDVVMPGMGGLKLAQILAEEQPGLPVVLATGYSEEIVESGTAGRPVILKPYRLATLSDALAAALRETQAAPPPFSSS